MSFKRFFKKHSLRADDRSRTRAAELTLRRSVYPIFLVTLLFFLWGFSYGLLDTLNKHFQNILEINGTRSAGLQAAYFGAYPLASIGHAAWVLRHFGYRAVFIWGLCLYALGALLAIPALKAESFEGFCACIFIIGNGLGSLETAANPYIASTVVAPILGSYVFFNFDDDRALANVQWVYISIAVFVLLLATIFYLSNIPEITDADMEFQAEEIQAGGSSQQPFWRQWRLFHAAFSQFCYTGAQVGIASFFINYAVNTRLGTSDALAAKLFAGAQASFAIGRFAGLALMRFTRPRWVLLAFLSGVVVFIIPAITERGNTGISMLYVVMFFESVCFPTIVALGMRGLGRHTKRGSGWIIGGVVGGACVPPATGAAADYFKGKGYDSYYGLAMFVPLLFMVLSLGYVVCVNFVPAYKTVVDSMGDTDIGIVLGHEDVESNEYSVSASEKSHGKHLATN